VSFPSFLKLYESLRSSSLMLLALDLAPARITARAIGAVLLLRDDPLQAHAAGVAQDLVPVALKVLGKANAKVLACQRLGERRLPVDE
jgi:hypothetical protein